MSRESALSEIWRPKFDLKECRIQQETFDEPASHLNLTSLLQRGTQRFGDEFKMTVTINGIYGLPEEWAAKQDDPAEQAFQYEVRAFGCHFKGGKFHPKEADDEPAAADAASKAASKAPAKGAKKVEEPEELTEEEKQKLAAEQAERESLNEQLQSAWATKS